jgi:hypothetical protein
LLELMRPRFFLLPIYLGAIGMLLTHFALQVSCIAFDALQLTPNLVLRVPISSQPEQSNHCWVSPLVLSLIPPVPLDIKIRMI